MMKIFPFYLVLFVFISITSAAQENYNPGIVVTNQGDTLHGLIKNNSSFLSAQVCVFREDMESRKQKFSPSEIKIYKEQDGRYFISKDIITDKIVEKVFLELLLDGIVDLYYYRDFTMNEFYFVDNGDGRMQLLKNDKYTQTINGLMYEKYTREFEKVLKDVFIKSDSIQTRIKKIDIDRESLVKISKDYHDEVCRDGACVIYQKKSKKVSVAFGPYISYSLLSFTDVGPVSRERFYYNNLDFGLISVPSAGLFIFSELPYIGDRFQFHYNIGFSRYSFSDKTFYDTPSSSFDYESEIDVTHNCFDNKLLLNFKLSFKNIRPVLQIGPYCNVMFNPGYRRETKTINEYGEVAFTSIVEVYEFSEVSGVIVDFGICAGLGINGKLHSGRYFSSSLLYQHGSGYFFNTSSNYFTIMLGIQLFKPKK